MSFTGKSPAETYKDILQIDNSNSGADSTARTIKTGDGTSSAISLSDRHLKVKSNTNNTTALDVLNASDASKFSVDTTNNQVKALGHHVNTQYAYFGIGADMQQTLVADTHYGIPFFGMAQKVEGWIADFGTGTDPDTSFTTANTLSQKGSQLAGLLWYVPDNITIDAVYSIEGADQATGDTTRMHLYSYTFNSGSTSALADGTLLAHNSDVTNAGSEQAYLSTWTIDSSSVAAGKVICAFFRSDSVNSDYTTNITVKYHLT